MKHGQLEGAGKYYGALFFSLGNIMFNGVAELSITVIKLPIFYKQRDFLFFPAWAFALPICVLRVPLSLLESGLWVILTYYTIGFAPAASRYENTISRYRVSQCHWNAIIGLLFHHSLLFRSTDLKILFYVVYYNLSQVFSSVIGILLCESNGSGPIPLYCCSWKDKSCGTHTWFLHNFTCFCPKRIYCFKK